MAKDLNKQSVANQYFEKAIKRDDNKLKEADRKGYVQAWNRAGQIIARNRKAGRTPRKTSGGVSAAGTTGKDVQGDARPQEHGHEQ